MISTFLASLQLNEDTLKTLSYVAGPRSGADLKTFADALRRSLALGGEAVFPRAIAIATKALLPRLGIEGPGMEPARMFLSDEPRFIGTILHADLGVRQDSLAQMFDCSQSKISRWSNDWSPDVDVEERARA